MRMLFALFVMMVLVVSAGCPREGGFSLLRPGPIKPPTGPAEAAPPSAAQELVDYLNNESAKVSGIQSDDITLHIAMGNSLEIPITGRIRAQGPRNFRMTARALGRDEVDLGSNNQEFWYWIRQGDKYQVFCSYKAIEDGRVGHMPFPFQPDWVLEAMGMGQYGPAEKYELVDDKANQKLKLIESTKSPQGTPVKKIIVFNRNRAKNDAQPQVTDFLLVDEKTNKLICAAHITKRQKIKDRKTGADAYLPREMRLEWPEQKLKLGLTLDGIQLTQQLQNQANLFMRPRLQGIESFDLATMRPEGVQPAGGPPGIPR